MSITERVLLHTNLENLKKYYKHFKKDKVIEEMYYKYQMERLDKGLLKIDKICLEERINKAIEYINNCGDMNLVNDYSFPTIPVMDGQAKRELTNILQDRIEIDKDDYFTFDVEELD